MKILAVAFISLFGFGTISANELANALNCSRTLENMTVTLNVYDDLKAACYKLEDENRVNSAHYKYFKEAVLRAESVMEKSQALCDQFCEDKYICNVELLGGACSEQPL